MKTEKKIEALPHRMLENRGTREKMLDYPDDESEIFPQSEFKVSITSVPNPPTAESLIFVADLQSLIKISERTQKPILRHVSRTEGSLGRQTFYITEDERVFAFKSTVRSESSYSKRIVSGFQGNSRRKTITSPSDVVMLTSARPGGKSGERRLVNAVDYEQLTKVANAVEKPILFYTDPRTSTPIMRWEKEQQEKDQFYVSLAGIDFVFSINSSKRQSEEEKSIIEKIIKESSGISQK